MPHHNPWSVSIELVEGCNRMCLFCGIWSMWKHREDRILKFMDLELVKEVSSRLSTWLKNKRFEFIGRGEPTLHPNVIEVISIVRQNCPNFQLMMATNGVTLQQYGLPFVKELFAAGLNILMVETYTKNERPRLINIGQTLASRTSVSYFNYYDTDDIKLFGYNSNKIKAYVTMDDIGSVAKSKLTRKFVNQGGNVNYKKIARFGVEPMAGPLAKRCTRLFREIVIQYDGAIPICCMDWCREFVVGKFPEEDLPDIWNKPAWNYARHLIYHKSRIFSPCFKCDNWGGVRQGFLKDPLDKPLNTKEAKSVLAEHYASFRSMANPNANPKLFYEGIREYLRRNTTNGD